MLKRILFLNVDLYYTQNIQKAQKLLFLQRHFFENSDFRSKVRAKIGLENVMSQ